MASRDTTPIDVRDNKTSPTETPELAIFPTTSGGILFQEADDDIETDAWIATNTPVDLMRVL